MKKTKRKISLLLAFIILVSSFPVFSSLNVGAGSIVNEKVEGRILYSYEFKVLKLINKERSKRGISELKMSTGLMKVATRRAAELSLYYSHSRPNGEEDAFGMYAWEYHVGENIAINQPTPEKVVNAWMQSNNHKQNILNKKYRSVGIGCFKVDGVIYWEQFFVDNKISKNTSQPNNKTTTYAIPIKKNRVILRQKEKVVYIYVKRTKNLRAYQNPYSLNGFYFITRLKYNCLTFKSNNSKIVKVDKKGNITGVQRGKTSVIAYVKGYPYRKLTWVINVR